MKELKIRIGGIWGCVSAVVIALIISGSAIFISTQYNQTQKEVAEIQAAAEKESAATIKEGLNNIGSGVCRTSDRTFVSCAF